MQLDTIVCSDVLPYLATLPDNSVHCVVSSPPYFGHRDYDADGQIGSEPTPQEFIAALAAVFGEIRRVLRPDGTVYLNLGDTYAADRGGSATGLDKKAPKANQGRVTVRLVAVAAPLIGFKHKDLMMIPHRAAIALQDSGWYVRAEIPWIKLNPMPGRAYDRPHVSHEYVFMLTKSDNYYYDQNAAKRPLSNVSETQYRAALRKNKSYNSKQPYRDNFPDSFDLEGRTVRTGDFTFEGITEYAESLYGLADELLTLQDTNGAAVINDQIVALITKSEPNKTKHAASFPTALIRPLIGASCPENGIVLDPFMGSGTTALVARNLGRHYIGCDLNPDYVAIALDRLRQPFESRKVQGESIDNLPLFNQGVENGTE